ncbi:hypothetical protein [Sphingomonas sp. 3-13AW]|uniref:hypothetical protein n=1 Tax=Sphingomonas sp. 3-13AW TaxID=3050450 RepID=UPI003BB62ADC
MKKLRATFAALARLNFRSAMRLLTIHERAPIIEIKQSAWRTQRPSVHVSITSRRGSTTVMSQLDDDAGNAHCTMHALTLSTITGLVVVDRRQISTNQGARGIADFKSAPRDAAKPKDELTRGTLGSFPSLGGLTTA